MFHILFLRATKFLSNSIFYPSLGKLVVRLRLRQNANTQWVEELRPHLLPLCHVFVSHSCINSSQIIFVLAVELISSMQQQTNGETERRTDRDKDGATQRTTRGNRKLLEHTLTHVRGHKFIMCRCWIKRTLIKTHSFLPPTQPCPAPVVCVCERKLTYNSRTSCLAT